MICLVQHMLELMQDDDFPGAVCLNCAGLPLDTNTPVHTCNGTRQEQVLPCITYLEHMLDWTSTTTTLYSEIRDEYIMHFHRLELPGPHGFPATRGVFKLVFQAVRDQIQLVARVMPEELIN